MIDFSKNFNIMVIIMIITVNMMQNMRGVMLMVMDMNVLAKRSFDARISSNQTIGVGQIGLL